MLCFSWRRFGASPGLNNSNKFAFSFIIVQRSTAWQRGEDALTHAMLHTTQLQQKHAVTSCEECLARLPWLSSQWLYSHSVHATLVITTRKAIMLFTAQSATKYSVLYLDIFCWQRMILNFNLILETIDQRNKLRLKYCAFSR